MSLESIVTHILSEAQREKETILVQAHKDAGGILQAAHEEAEKLYQEMFEKEKLLLENQRKNQLVHARLEGRKELLQVKQALIGDVFTQLKAHLTKSRFKKQLVMAQKTEEEVEDIDFYLEHIRLDCESEIANILFS